MTDWQPFVQLGLQIPVVGAFIWFALQLLRNFLESQKERDHEWRSYLAEQRDTFLRSIETKNASTEKALIRLAEEIKTLAAHQAATTSILHAHDVYARTAVDEIRRAQ